VRSRIAERITLQRPVAEESRQEEGNCFNIPFFCFKFKTRVFPKLKPNPCHFLKKNRFVFLLKTRPILGKFCGDSARDRCDPIDFPAILQLRIPRASSNGRGFKDRGITLSDL